MNTNQYSELDRIKLKIKALANKTIANGATEEEALSAMHMVGKLLNQYNLSMNELDVRDATFSTIYCGVNRDRRHPIDNAVMALAELFGAKTWFHKTWGEKSSSYAFFGQTQDLEMIDYLFKVILTALNSEAATYRTTDTYLSLPRGWRKTSYVSFQKGMAIRIAQRLREMKKENDAELNLHKTGTALVVLKGQLTEEAFKKEGIRLSSVQRTISRSHADSYHAGREAGNKVNLSRPITTSNPKGYIS